MRAKGVRVPLPAPDVDCRSPHPAQQRTQCSGRLLPRVRSALPAGSESSGCALPADPRLPDGEVAHHVQPFCRPMSSPASPSQSAAACHPPRAAAGRVDADRALSTEGDRSSDHESDWLLQVCENWFLLYRHNRQFHRQFHRHFHLRNHLDASRRSCYYGAGVRQPVSDDQHTLGVAR